MMTPVLTVALIAVLACGWLTREAYMAAGWSEACCQEADQHADDAAVHAGDAEAHSDEAESCRDQARDYAEDAERSADAAERNAEEVPW